ncbi:MAG: DUF3150 domain-containing protein [Bacteroidales bacterium]|nr:DUF3150 domain-containing protein [Bacteroidales bacterium]
MSYENTFESACLVVVTIKNWNAFKKIPKEKLSQLVKNKKLSERVRGTKELVDRKKLADINSVINKTRNTVKAYSLPFPIPTVFLVPKQKIEKLAEEINEFKEALNDAVDDFAEDYDKYITEAEETLGEELFNENDFPKNIKERFQIEVRFIEMTVPGKLKKFSPEVYKEEERKYKEMMEQARKEAVLFLREGFAEILNKMIETLTGNDGEPKKIRSDAVQRIDKFFDEFLSKNIFKDDELQNMIKQAKEVMMGVNAKDLKNSEKLRQYVTKNIEKVQEELDKSITTYKRSLLI